MSPLLTDRWVKSTAGPTDKGDIKILHVFPKIFRRPFGPEPSTLHPKVPTPKPCTLSPKPETPDRKSKSAARNPNSKTLHDATLKNIEGGNENWQHEDL